MKHKYYEFTLMDAMEAVDEYLMETTRKVDPVSGVHKIDGKSEDVSSLSTLPRPYRMMIRCVADGTENGDYESIDDGIEKNKPAVVRACIIAGKTLSKFKNDCESRLQWLTRKKV